MPFVYYGRKTNFSGKSLWEIVGSLKNYGVGRMVIRNQQKRYKEPSFMRIVSAEPEMDVDNRKGTIFVEKVFRGHNAGVRDFSRVGYKTDYRLVPKHEEHKYIKALEDFQKNELHINIYSQVAEMPPLLKLLAEDRGHHSNTLKMKLKSDMNPRTRLAKDGETPNTFATPSLGTPICKRLYEGVLE